MHGNLVNAHRCRTRHQVAAKQRKNKMRFCASTTTAAAAGNDDDSGGDGSGVEDAAT